MKPHIAITLGDPAGIGPEIVAKALRDPRVHRSCTPIVFGTPGGVRMGNPSRKAGLAALGALRQGLALVLSGRAQALVTAPVSKESFRLADHGFPGHTEWLADACAAPDAAMLMVSGPLRAILLTRHIPLREVSKHLSMELIVDSAILGHAFLKAVTPTKPPHGRAVRLMSGGVGAQSLALVPGFRRDDGRRRPRLVLCGLNPHAGDHGIIGREEDLVFRPAVRSLKRQGILVEGPLPADSVFPLMAQGRFDLALAAYHDQGMIPLKLYAPDRVVNITLGLPFIRTSPGHGTAYDIAGQGIARPGPMIEAILLAAQYSRATRTEGRGTRSS